MLDAPVIYTGHEMLLANPEIIIYSDMTFSSHRFRIELWARLALGPAVTGLARPTGLRVIVKIDGCDQAMQPGTRVFCRPAQA